MRSIYLLFFALPLFGFTQKKETQDKKKREWLISAQLGSIQDPRIDIDPGSFGVGIGILYPIHDSWWFDLSAFYGSSSNNVSDTEERELETLLAPRFVFNWLYSDWNLYVGAGLGWMEAEYRQTISSPNTTPIIIDTTEKKFSGVSGIANIGIFLGIIAFELSLDQGMFGRKTEYYPTVYSLKAKFHF